MAIQNNLHFGIANAGLEFESGDKYFIKHLDNSVLIAVIDGLGHGKEAAEAADSAVKLLDTFSGETLENLIIRCHHALTTTRGVVLSLAQIHSNFKMTWLGIGNVTGLFWGKKIDKQKTLLFTPGGIIGMRLPIFKTASVLVTPGDTLIFATDGIRMDFTDINPIKKDPQRIADYILTQYRNPIDDALVLVTRWGEL